MKKLLLVIPVLALIAAGCNSSQSISPPSQSTNTTPAPVTINQPTQTQPPVVSNPTPSPQKKSSNIDDSKACSQQGLVLANRFQSQNNNLGGPGGGFWNYESHYNNSLGKCFFYRFSTSPYNGNSVLNEVLSDAYDNTTVASYYDETTTTNVEVTKTCAINGVMGCTVQEFRAFINTEMESTSH